jgi:hypothetical protein
MNRAGTVLKGLVLLLFVFGFVGCDTLDDLNPFDNEKEASGIIEAIGASSLTVDGIEYVVTSDTEFEGVDGLADLAVGDEVGIEYKEKGGVREAVEVELAGADDD